MIAYLGLDYRAQEQRSLPHGRRKENRAMPIKKRSLAERRLRWQTVTTNFRVFREEVPHLQKDVDELRTLAEEVMALSAQQARYRARLQEITKRIGVLGKQADNLRGRIGSALRAHLGFTSQDLIQLGFRPLPSRDQLTRDLELLETPSPVGTVLPLRHQVAVGRAAKRAAEPDPEG
jgi:hypothetical protein